MVTYDEEVLTYQDERRITDFMSNEGSAEDGEVEEQVDSTYN